jgi:hypothetical protein
MLRAETRRQRASSGKSAPVSVAQEELINHLCHKTAGARLLDGRVEVMNIKNVHLSSREREV